MLQRTISKLVAWLGYTEDDDAIYDTIERIDALKRSTSGADRATCHWALAECRELLTPRGRLRRHAAATARRSTVWGGDVA